VKNNEKKIKISEFQRERDNKGILAGVKENQTQNKVKLV